MKEPRMEVINKGIESIQESSYSIAQQAENVLKQINSFESRLHAMMPTEKNAELLHLQKRQLLEQVKAKGGDFCFGYFIQKAVLEEIFK